MAKTLFIAALFLALIGMGGCSKPQSGPYNQYQQQIDAADRAQRQLERQ